MRKQRRAPGVAAVCVDAGARERTGVFTETMMESEHLESSLPELDQSNDPRGGAIAWALLTVIVTVVVSILLTVT